MFVRPWPAASSLRSRRSADVPAVWGSLRRLVAYGVRALAGVGLVTLIVLYTPLANTLARPLLTVRSNAASADVAVVLSGGRFDDGTLNSSSLERTVAAVRLYHAGRVRRLIFSGGPCCGQSASALMARLAMELGVPASRIELDEQSTRTSESAARMAALLHARRVTSVILITSPLHLLRGTRSFAAAGLTVQPVRSSEIDLQLVTNAWDRVDMAHDALHEYVGLAYYRLRRWL